MHIKQQVVRAEFLLQAILEARTQSLCPHCRSDRHARIGRKAVVIEVLRCLSCGLSFTKPVYRSRLSTDFYDRLYSAEGSTTELPDERELRHLKESGFQGSDKDRSVTIERLRALTPSRPGRLLELGSSWGYFLFQARVAGFDVKGVEIGAKRRRFGRQHFGVEILPSLEAVDDGVSFDLIFAAHVLEHLPDVSTIYDRLASLLTDTGQLFLEVPNFDPGHLGPVAMRWVGAVHPIGYDSSWFSHLLAHGFTQVQVFADWADMPNHAVERSTSNVIIVRALKGPTT